MSNSINEDDLFTPWDDFSSTQLENIEKSCSNKNYPAQNADKLNLCNSINTSFDVFLDELLGLPTKFKPKPRSVLGDISNRQQPKSKFTLKEKKPAPKPTPKFTRMDSADESIWNEIDNDLLSLIDVDSNKGTDQNSIEPKDTTSITTVTPSIDHVYKLEPEVDELDSIIPLYEDVFLPLSSKYEPLPPPGLYQSNSFESSAPTSCDQDELLSVPEPTLKSTSPPPLPVNENLFHPQVTADGYVIKELPTPTGPEAGFQSAKLIASKSTTTKDIREGVKTLESLESSNIKKESSIQNKSSFSTASGKELNLPSAKGKQKATDLFDEPEVKYDDVITKYGGFRTGNSKKSFDISPQAKKNAISLLKQAEADNNKLKIDNTTTPKSEENLLPNELPKKHLLEETEDPIAHKHLKSSFSTASGKTIKGPTTNGIQKATELFKQSQDPAKYNTVIEQYGGFQTGFSKKNFDISSQAQRKAIHEFKQHKAESNIPNKPVNITDHTNSSIQSEDKPTESLKRNLLEEEETKNHKRQKIKPLEKPSFSTGSGKKLKAPSSEGIQKAIELFKGSQDPVRYENVIQQFGGFKTGSSKKSFDISTQAKRNAVTAFNESEAEAKNKHVRLSPETTPSVLNQPNSKEITEETKDKKVQTEKTPTKSISSEVSKPDSAALSTTKPGTFPKRSNNRTMTLQRTNKPFKSPIIPSNIELTKRAVSNRSLAKPRLTPVFDLKAPDFRFKLSTLGRPGEFSKADLIADNMPTSIINMTFSTSKKYLFNENWGTSEARNELIQAGALSRRATMEWVENHYGWIVWKTACLIRSYNQFKDRWNPQFVLEQLLYRYEREINLGNRSVLRRIMEKDDLPLKHMILMVSDIIEIQSAIQYNTSSKYRIQLSDGWYQVPACIDLRIEKAIQKKKVKVGSKLSICGANLIGDKDGIHPLENTDNSTMLSISANSSLPARWHTKLGYHPKKLIFRKLDTIFDDGGMVTAIDIVVCRKFPILYSETLPNGSIITRNAKEEEEERRVALGFDNYGVRRSINQTEVERRVSGYFKIRICDHISPYNQEWSTLLLSNANEINHMDITEGCRYKVFSVMPYHPKNKKYPGLDLKTTRMTRWEPAGTLNLLNSYKSRALINCGNIQFQDLTSDFDLVVLVLHTGPSTLENVNGRKLWKQTLLVSDESQDICQVNFRLPMGPFSDITGKVLGLLNVRFETYDSKFDITCLKATDESESVSKISAAAEYVQEGMFSLKRWVNENPERVERLHNRIQKIVQ